MIRKHATALILFSAIISFGAQDGQPPPEVIRAAQNGEVETVRALLMADPALVHVRDDFGATALHWATVYGRRDVVSELLKYEPEANLEERHGGTTLHWAAHFDDPEVVSWLIEKGAEVDHRNRMGRTPLHVAARRGNSKVAKLLLQRGADLDADVRDGSTALHIAARNGHQEMLERLIAGGADRTVVNHAGRVYEDELFIRPATIQASPKVLSAFAGRYRAEERPRDFDIRWESGRLYYYAFGKDQLLPISKGRFITHSERLFFTFTRDQDGDVDGLAFEFQGGRIEASRVGDPPSR